MLRATGTAATPKTPRHALMGSLVPEFAPDDALKACQVLKRGGETIPGDSSVPFGDKGERYPVVAFVRGWDVEGAREPPALLPVWSLWAVVAVCASNALVVEALRGVVTLSWMCV